MESTRMLANHAVPSHPMRVSLGRSGAGTRGLSILAPGIFDLGRVYRSTNIRRSLGKLPPSTRLAQLGVSSEGQGTTSVDDPFCFLLCHHRMGMVEF